MTMKIFINVKPGKLKPGVKYLGKNVYSVDEYEVELTTLPIEGQCNEELIVVLSNYFKIAKNKIKIVSGLKSRKKVIQLQ